MIRTHDAGSLRASDIGQQVTLAGWVARRRDHGGVAFIDLRDGSGISQIVIREEEVAHPLRNEYCLKIVGTVSERPEGNANPNLPSGEIEVVADIVEILSESAPLPFPIEEFNASAIGEEVRLRYRYLDLRRENMARNLRTRAAVTRIIREVLTEDDFLDIETPYLTASTPEGARDFLVPARLHPGSWYALPQSPQLFKQLLMVAGMERYYQIARCFRDEDSRADRQPEFTQLDIEMSFLEEEDIYALTEKLLVRIWKDVVGFEIPTPIPRMTFEESVRRFGIDRPDMRFGCELVDFTDYFKDTPFRVFAPKGRAWHVGAVVMPGGASQPRRTLDAWQEFAKARGARGLAYVLVQEDGTLGGPVAKNLSETEREGLVAHAGAAVGDCIFFGAGEYNDVKGLLAAVRDEIGERCDLIDHDRWEFLWVTDAPMFERIEGEDGDDAWTSIHHPFTAPAPEFADSFHTDPASALSQAYDITLNGNELGGGSIRIHRSEMQERVFDTLGLTEEQAQGQFGFLLEAFKFGPPPHGGIALGIDRVLALLTGADSIRDVMAFPKTASGADPLTGAPTPITAAQRKETGVDAVRKKDVPEAKPAAEPKA
ncbi:MAG: aspartate--tRNA ligase [Actinomycetota bacterium]|nr:aspartate--tRNA ligase [Actinomycetota bacterium]